MLQLIRKYRVGFLFYDLLLMLGIILVLAIPRFELHILMNSSHTEGQDVFFKSITWLGDGWFAVFFSLVFLALRFRYFFMLIFSFSVSGLLAQAIKRVGFPGSMRPAAFIAEMPGLELVDGVSLHQTLSFPSGHTTTAFAVLVLAGLILNNKTAFLMGMILAWCVALSRVYLSQHFLIDVLAGSMLGILSALFFYWYFQRFKPDWLDHSLLTLLSGKKKQ